MQSNSIKISLLDLDLVSALLNAALVEVGIRGMREESIGLRGIRIWDLVNQRDLKRLVKLIC